MTFEEIVKFIKEFYSYPFFLYNKDEEKFYEINKDNIKNIKIPGIIEPFLKEEYSGAKYFIKKQNKLIFLFISLFIGNNEYVLILYDNKSLLKLSYFLRVLVETDVTLKINLEQSQKEVEFLRDELSECESTVNNLDEQVKDLEKLIDDYKLRVEGLEESVEVLGKSRKKMLNLIDGMKNPLFSVDLNYELNNVNRALGEFTNVDSLPKFIGSKCYKTIFNFDQPCNWCRLDDVVDAKNSISQQISLNKGDRIIWLEQIMYPIFDDEGNVVEVGEILEDITEQYELLKNLEITQNKVKKISKDRVQKLNEINQLKIEYQNLLEEYNLLVERNRKFENVIEKLIKESHVGQILDLKKENKSLKIKLEKLNRIIERLKVEIDNLKHKELENTKKSVYSIDRLFNMITKREDFKKEEFEKVLELIKTHLDFIKNKIGIKEEDNGSKGGN